MVHNLCDSRALRQEYAVDFSTIWGICQRLKVGSVGFSLFVSQRATKSPPIYLLLKHADTLSGLIGIHR